MHVLHWSLSLSNRTLKQWLSPWFVQGPPTRIPESHVSHSSFLLLLQGSVFLVHAILPRIKSRLHSLALLSRPLSHYKCHHPSILATLLCIQLLCSPTQHAFEDAQFQLGATLPFNFLNCINLSCVHEPQCRGGGQKEELQRASTLLLPSGSQGWNLRARASAFCIIPPGSETPSFKVPSHLSGLKTKCDLAWSLAGSAESVLSQSPVRTDGARFPSPVPVLASASASFVFWTPGFSGAQAGILSAS